MKYTVLLLALLLASLSAFGQRMVVARPVSEDDSLKIAAVDIWIDSNKDTCAVVVVDIDVMGDVTFEGDVVKYERRGSRYWLWMSPGANWLNLTSGNYTPLMISFAPVKSGRIYSATVERRDELLRLYESMRLAADRSLLDAQKFKRITPQGEVCALVRIGLVADKVKFVGDVVASERHEGEWWVWMAPKSRSLEIRTEAYLPLKVTFEPLEAGVTYLMALETLDEDAYTRLVSYAWKLDKRKKRPVGPWLRVSWMDIISLSAAYDYTVFPWLIVGGGLNWGYRPWNFIGQYTDIETGEYVRTVSGMEGLASVLLGYAEVELRTPRYRWSFFLNIKAGLMYPAGQAGMSAAGNEDVVDFYDENGVLIQSCLLDRKPYRGIETYGAATVGVSYKRMSLGFGYLIEGGVHSLAASLSYDIPLKKNMLK